MSGDWLDWLRVFGALLLAGATVKLMDDALDVDFDLCQGKRTLAMRLGRACLPYSLVSFGLAMTLNPTVALSTFLGSYAVGMFTRLDERLPSHVPAYVEIAVALLLSVCLVGWRAALWGVAMMCFIDWLDDVMDRQKDKTSGQFNVAVRFGLIEVLFAITIVFCIALYAQVVWTLLTLVALVVLTIVFELMTKRILVQDDEGVEESW